MFTCLYVLADVEYLLIGLLDDELRLHTLLRLNI